MILVSALRSAAVCLLGLLILVPTHSDALVVTYTDRAAWELAATTAGLSIVTEDFASDPGGAFTLGGVDFTRIGGSHDAGNELILGGAISSINFTGGTVYGYGGDFDLAFGTVTTVNVRGVDVSPDFGGTFGFAGDLPTFLGILSDVQLDPSCPGFPCTGGTEILMTGQGSTSSPSLDNLSVAVPVPEPMGLLALAATSCALVSLRRGRGGRHGRVA